MAAPTLASVGELITFARLLDADVARVEMVLGLATAAIEGELDRRLTPSTVPETVLVDGSGSAELWLPEWPIISVTAVAVDAVTVPPAEYTFGGGVLRRLRQRWPVGTGNVTVTYTHGYTQLPGDLRLACLQLAQALWEGRADVSRQADGDYAVTYVSGWRSLAARYRRVSVA